MPRQFQEMAAKSLHIPGRCALGEPVITSPGARRVYLENYERIVSLDPDEIRLQTPDLQDPDSGYLPWN